MARTVRRDVTATMMGRAMRRRATAHAEPAGSVTNVTTSANSVVSAITARKSASAKAIIRSLAMRSPALVNAS